ncbi:MAG: putative lipid II flippase FtsW [Bacilli bacterium]
MVLNKRQTRIIILIIILFFCLFSIFMVYEASSIWSKFKYNDEFYYLKRQLIYVVIGFVALFIGIKINMNILKKYSLIFVIITLFLLVLVLIPGIGLERGGSSSWLGFSSFSFQPSELFKIAIICYFAKNIDENYMRTNSIKSFIPPFIFLGIGTGLIMIQPDFGTCVVTLATVFLLLFLTKLKYRYFIIALGIGLVAMIALIVSAPYRLARITSFIDPFSDPLGSGFQIIQSLFALGPGGLLGKGVSGSVQNHYYLPEPQTDFIYSIIVEEFGFIGGFGIIVLYALLFYLCILLIKNEFSKFKIYISCGILSLFMIQVIINLGVVTSLFPVTGITLPLLSYGGSSLVVLLFSLGLILNGD